MIDNLSNLHLLIGQPLPELSIKKEWLEELCAFSVGKIFIAGGYYDQSYNICPLIINGRLIHPPYKKINPSPAESVEIYGKQMKSGNIVYRYITPSFSFSILTCIDNPLIAPILLSNTDFSPDIIINPCYDENLKRFQKQCDNFCENSSIYFIQINRASKGKKYGRSAILANEHRSGLESYEGVTRDSKIDTPSVIARICDEEILIVDIDITNKGPQNPLQPNYRPRIIPLKKYFYNDDESWICNPS